MSSIAPTTFKCAPCQLFFMSADDLVTHQRREDCLRLTVMQMSQEEEHLLPNASTLEEDDGSAASATTAMSIEGISDGPYSAESSARSAPIVDTDMTDAYVTSGDDQEDWENASIFEHFDTDYEYSTIQEFGISLIKLLDQNGVSREVQRKLVKHINRNLLSKFESNAVQALGGFLPSQESIHALISKGTQALSKNYHVCPSGCKLYPAETAYPISCEHCSSPRYKNHNQASSLSAQSVDLDADNAPVLQPQQILSVASVASALGELLLDDQFREDIKYKHQFDDPGNDSEALQDIFSGSVYRNLRDQGVVQKNDLCLLIMVDGFQNKLSPKNSSALVHCMVMNASPDKRYQTKSMISLSVIGGPGKPKDIMSFLKPILDEIHHLNQNGVCVKKNDQVVYAGFVHLLGCTGDIPGIAELMGHHGHASFFGCRMCQVQGVHPQGSVNGMYFPGTGAGRTIEELKNGDPDRNLNAVDPLFCHLNTFTGVEFFLGDEMHLLGQGLSKLLFNMLNPRTADNFLPLTPPSLSSSLSSSESQPPLYPFRMFNSSPNHFKTVIGGLISESKRTIPPTFDGCWDSNFGYYRSVDYLDFLLFVTPTIIVDKLVDNRARNAMMALINGCSLALQWSITKAEMDQMDSEFKIWHDYLRSEIAAGQLSERVFTINNHYLSHLKQLMMKMGPLRSYSCRPMERTIKMFTNLITSTSNPAVNASNVFRRCLDYKRFAIQTIDLKHFPAKEFDPNSYRIHPDNTTNNHSFGELWEPFKLDTLTPSASRSSERQVCFGLKQSKVTNAFVRYYSRVRGRTLMVSDINWGAVELASAVEKDGIVHGSLMDRKLRHLKTRSNAAVLFKEVRKVGQRSVDVWLVAVVQCYLTHEQDGETRFLAVGEVMKKHEFDNNNVMTVTMNASGPEAQKIAVFSTEDILENVGLVQYSQNSYKFKVIWPYMCYYKGAGPLEIGRLTDV